MDGHLTRGHAFEKKSSLIVEDRREVTWGILILCVCSSTEKEHIYICFEFVLVIPAG